MRLTTRLRSLGMRYFGSEKFLLKQRAKARKQNRKLGQPPVIHYFHQVDDAHSYITVQHIERLQNFAKVQVKCHLVGPVEPQFQGSVEHFAKWALADAKSIAEFYGRPLPIPLASSAPRYPNPANTANAAAILSAHAGHDDFSHHAIAIGEALWSGDAVAADQGNNTKTALAVCEQRIDAAARLRRKLGHYLAANFYFEGEWFHGIDRLPLLCQRLSSEGLANADAATMNPFDLGHTKALKLRSGAAQDGAAQEICLEYFPSLRSPYTAVGHSSVIDLVSRFSGTFRLRPVMPMLMRGVPAPKIKQRYIIMDAARAARANRVEFGGFVDPFGAPVKIGFALFHQAVLQDKGLEFVGAYLRGAFAKAIDISSFSGLQQILDHAGVTGNAKELAQHQRQHQEGQAVLDDNLQSMLAAGLWGVPSFRISNPNHTEDFCCWGQDRIWRVEHEIARRSLS